MLYFAVLIQKTAARHQKEMPGIKVDSYHVRCAGAYTLLMILKGDAFAKLFWIKSCESTSKSKFPCSCVSSVASSFWLASEVSEVLLDCSGSSNGKEYCSRSDLLGCTSKLFLTIEALLVYCSNTGSMPKHEIHHTLMFDKPGIQHSLMDSNP